MYKLNQIEKKSSIGHIKNDIIKYDFSNSPNYFFIITKQNRFKIFNIHGHLNESSVYMDLKIEADACAGSLFIISEDNSGKRGIYAYAID